MMEKQMKHTMLAVQAFLNEEAGVIRHEALAEALEKEGFVRPAAGSRSSESVCHTPYLNGGDARV